MPQHEKRVVTVEQLISRQLEQWAIYPNNGDTVNESLKLRRGRVEVSQDLMRYAGNGILASFFKGRLSAAAYDIKSQTYKINMYHPEFEEITAGEFGPIPQYNILAVPDGQVFLDSGQQVHYERQGEK